MDLEQVDATDEIKMVENFITNDEVKDIISIIDNKYEERLKTVFGNPSDGRFIFSQPKESVSLKYFKSFSDKLKEKFPEEYSDLYFHHVIYAKQVSPAGKVLVHMDPKGNERCSECTMTAIIYLNDDYDGGELYFPYLDFEAKVKPGTLVSFPQQNDIYLHGVNAVTGGNRYIVNMCYTTNPAKQLDFNKPIDK